MAISEKTSLWPIRKEPILSNFWCLVLEVKQHIPFLLCYMWCQRYCMKGTVWAGFYLGFLVSVRSCIKCCQGGSCPSRKIWDFRSSEINFDAIWGVKSHLEPYVLRIIQVVFAFVGEKLECLEGKLPPSPKNAICPSPASQYKFLPSTDNVFFPLL